MMTKTTLLAFAAAALLAPGIALAQTAEPAPVRPVRPADRPLVERTPIVTVNLLQAVDRERLTERAYSRLNLSFQRRHATSRVTLDVTGGSSVRWYQTHSGLVTDAQAVEAGMRMRLSPRSALVVNQRVTYVPAMDAQVSNTAGVIAGVTTGTSLGLSRQFSRRTTGTLGYRFDRVEFSGEGRTATAHGVTASISRTARRHLTWQMAWDVSDAVTSSPISASDVRSYAAGLQVQYHVPSAPETTFSVRLAPTYTRLRQSGPADQVGRHTAIVLSGTGRVDHRINETWRVGASYERSLSTLDGYDQPIVAQAVGAHMDMRVRRLATVAASLYLSRGTPGIYQTAGRARALSASARVTMRTSAASGLFLDVAHSAYAVDGTLATGLQRQSFNRTTIRVGFTLDVTPLHPTGWLRGRW